MLFSRLNLSVLRSCSFCRQTGPVFDHCQWWLFSWYPISISGGAEMCSSAPSRRVWLCLCTYSPDLVTYNNMLLLIQPRRLMPFLAAKGALLAPVQYCSPRTLRAFFKKMISVYFSACSIKNTQWEEKVDLISLRFRLLCQHADYAGSILCLFLERGSCSKLSLRRASPV